MYPWAAADQKPVYSALAQINGGAVGIWLAIAPGNRITVTTSESGHTSKVAIADGGQAQSATGTEGSVTREDIGAISANCSTSSSAPVPRMTVTEFTAASINRGTLTKAQTELVRLEDAAGVIQVGAKKTGPGAFYTRWESSCGTKLAC